jgi:DNA invertase Pin-like site-specific DNA recombinase
VTVARYHRVSTEQQNLTRQTTATEKYVGHKWGDVETRSYADADTGTNTDREGYESLMADVEAGEIEAVVVKSVSRISRSVRDLQRTVDRLEEHETSLHIIDESLTIAPGDSDPFQNAVFQLLGVFAELEAAMTRERVRQGIAARQQDEDYHHGPAPLGFNKSEGRLIEAENYDRVVTTLEYVDRGEMSKREAARRLECSRSTIGRALERREVYGLP